MLHTQVAHTCCTYMLRTHVAPSQESTSPHDLPTSQLAYHKKSEINYEGRKFN